MNIRSLFRKKTGKFKDTRDGKTYKTIKIGDQVWLAENFAFEPSIGKYWSYDDDKSNLKIYGYLYDWETAKAVCPEGWHLPSKAEFETLVKNYDGLGYKSYIALNEKGESGFNSLNGGARSIDEEFYGIDGYGEYWTSTKGENEKAWFLYIGLFGKRTDMDEISIEYGYSVRYIKDQ